MNNLKPQLKELDAIRNFCIIAHVDHGKSTLADRLLEATGTIDKRAMRAQVLDDMDLERERGITIKSHAIQMKYVFEGSNYTLNLIDTPGHVDFSYEVSRAIAACEGALLVVDASQGIEAQTIANLYLAIEQGLTIIPVLNKIDLASARTGEITDEIVRLIGCSEEDILHVSAKYGNGVEQLLGAVISKIPAPGGDASAPLEAMVFDAVYDPFVGIKVFFRIFNGELRRGDVVKFVQTQKAYSVEELGILRLQQVIQASISAGDVGYLIAGMRTAKEVKIGATITHEDTPCDAVIAGFSDPKPMLFAGIYPVLSSDYAQLRATLERLQLSDASLVWEVESSSALGFGFRCGFLGMLHMDIIRERLSREFDMNVITTMPSVRFSVTDRKGVLHVVQSPYEMPPAGELVTIEEPLMEVQIITTTEYIGRIIELCISRRGALKNQVHLSLTRVELSFELPLLEIIFDFFDQLKSVSRGYASLDYRLKSYVSSDLVRLDILLNEEKIDALSVIVHRSKSERWGRRVCIHLKEILPKQLFDIPIQAVIGSRVIARETIKAMRKNVTAKCYGGDITRKKKLWAKQKEGKKRMRQIGKVEVPQEAFLALLRVHE